LIDSESKEPKKLKTGEVKSYLSEDGIVVLFSNYWMQYFHRVPEFTLKIVDDRITLISDRAHQQKEVVEK